MSSDEDGDGGTGVRGWSGESVALPLGALLKVKSCLVRKVGSDPDVVDCEDVLSLELPLELVSDLSTIGVFFAAGMARRPGLSPGKIAGCADCSDSRPELSWDLALWCGGPGRCGLGSLLLLVTGLCGPVLPALLLAGQLGPNLLQMCCTPSCWLVAFFSPGLWGPGSSWLLGSGLCGPDVHWALWPCAVCRPAAGCCWALGPCCCSLGPVALTAVPGL